MNTKLQAWVVGIGTACKQLRIAANGMSRERLAALLDMSMSTIVRWEKREDPQMLFRSQVQDFLDLYEKTLDKKAKVRLYTKKEDAQKTPGTTKAKTKKVLRKKRRD